MDYHRYLCYRIIEGERIRARGREREKYVMRPGGSPPRAYYYYYYYSMVDQYNHMGSSVLTDARIAETGRGEGGSTSRPSETVQSHLEATQKPHWE